MEQPPLDDLTRIAQFCASLQGQVQVLGERLLKLEKTFSADKSAAKFEKRVKKATIDGGDKDIPRHAKKQGPESIVVGKETKK